LVGVDPIRDITPTDWRFGQSLELDSPTALPARDFPAKSSLALVDKRG
jgi:hypothetical protein